MSLQGVLSDFGAADVFQLIAQQRKTGVLEIQRGDRKLLVHFSEGQVVRARPAESRPDGAVAAFLLRVGAISEPELADAWRSQGETLEPLADVVLSERLVPKEELHQIMRLLSEETIFELFLWDDGEFAFRPGRVDEQLGDLLVGAEMVLLDALRMRDEWVQVQSGLSDLTLVVRQAVDVEVYQQKRGAIEAGAGMSGEQLDRLFSRCDGRLTARRVIDLSRLGTFQAARGLVGMLREGVLEVARRSAPARKARQRVTVSESWGKGVWILGLCGLVALGLLLVPAPRLDSHPLPRPILQAQRAQLSQGAQQRLRVALEAHKWDTGNYPESLASLSPAWDEFLAPVSLDRYIYARSVGTYTLRERQP